jgi:hypothetical protein
VSANALPQNLIILSETGNNLLPALEKHGIAVGHFTNGTYAPPSELIVPTVLAGFQHAVDSSCDQCISLIIAVNSNKSMLEIAASKARVGTLTEADKAPEDQYVRAQKVAIPVALQNPDSKVVVMFYDEETPNNLYDSLHASGFSMKTLFKWGYGTNPNAGVIEGAENFNKVFGHPLPNDIKPICHDITRRTRQEGAVSVVDLRVKIGHHGQPYISGKNECLFPLRDAELSVYGSRNNPVPLGADQKLRP